MMPKTRYHELAKMIRRCRYCSDVDDKVMMLYTINGMLPKSNRLEYPSLLTKDYVNKALDIIEERIDATANKAVTTQ